MIDLNSDITKEIRQWVKNTDWHYPGLGKECTEEFLQSDTDEHERQIVEHTFELDEEEFFDVSIDETIAYLNVLKAKGYEHIEQRWSGYESNYFVACKWEAENDDEYAQRIADLINDLIHKREKEIDEEKERQYKLKDLKKQVEELEKGKKK